MPIRRFAAAKINLYLHVLGRRPDGYHELDSLVVFADVGDELCFAPAKSLSLEVTGPFAAGLPLDSTNLVMRAAERLRQLAGVSAGARIRLAKNLPVASGVGGGSSDCAQTLLGLSALWGLEGLPEGLAVGLGADVPVCLEARAAYLCGIGERLDPAPPLPAVWSVLANPGVPVSTPAVFAARAGPFSAVARLDEAMETPRSLARALAVRRNDLEPAALEVAPAIAEVLRRLAAADGSLLARVSGSGATCFGLFASAASAASAAAAIARDHPAWWVRSARLAGPAAEPSVSGPS